MKKYVKKTGMLLGFVASIITIYECLPEIEKRCISACDYLFPENQAEIQYEILGVKKILETTDSIPGLVINFDSVSLGNKNLGLAAYYLRIRNIGDIGIPLSAYDGAYPMGLRIRNGFMPRKPELLKSSDNYLEKKLRIIAQSADYITFEPVIFNPDDFFEIVLIVIYKSGLEPMFEPTGKIAGVSHISVINTSGAQAEIPLFQKSFSGDILVQLVGALVYISITFIPVICLFYAVTNFKQAVLPKTKIVKPELLRQFKASTGYGSGKIEAAIFDTFKQDNGLKILRTKLQMLTNEQAINDAAARWRQILEATDGNTAKHLDLFYADGLTNALIREMIHEGFILSAGEKLSVNKELLKTLANFIDFIQQNKFEE